MQPRSRRRRALAPLPFLLLATAVGTALGAAVAVDLAPRPSLRSSLPLPDPVPSWGGPWSPALVAPEVEQGAGLDRLAGLVGLAGAAGVLAALGAVATLMGSGGASRGPEMAVRAALGAGPWRLRGRLLRDHALLLGVGLGGGAVLGLGVAVAARRSWPGPASLLPDAAPFLLVAALAGGLALLLSLWPSRAARPARLPALLAGARATADAREVGARRLLLVLQMAAAMAVPVPAILLLAPTPGVDGGADTVLAATAAPAGGWEGVLTRLREHPTLAAESIATPGAWDGLGPVDLAVTECRCVRGLMYLPFRGARARHHAVTPAFFADAGLEVLEGRALEPGDGAGAPPVAVVSRAFARENFDGSPLGRWVRIGAGEEGYHEVVGVVADRAVPGLARGGGAEIYLSLLQHPPERGVVAVRSAEGPDAAAAALAAALEGTGGDSALTLEAHRRARLAPLRWLGRAAAALALLALLSALGGVHAVSRLDVVLRGRELAVRRAVGATGPALGRWLLGRRVRDLAWGMGVGLWGAVSLVALLHDAAALPGPVRPGPFLGVAAAVAAVALLGAARGVRDAVAVSPASALAGAGEG